jgi:hypothetical protein
VPTGATLSGPPVQLTDVGVVPLEIEHVVAFVVVHDKLEVEALPAVTDAANVPMVVSAHTLAVQAHASSTPLVQGQSVVALLQPQAPDTHAVPLVSPVQTLHVFPLVPHWVGSFVPVTQLPALQHPPLQSCVVEHVNVQV